MYSPAVFIALFLGALLIVAPISGKLFLFPPYMLAVIAITINEIQIKKRLIANAKDQLIINISRANKVFLFIFLLFITNSAINYYTGLTFITALGNLFGGEVNYAAYQLFFKEEVRHNFELIKLVHVTSIAIIKSVAFYCIYLILFCRKNRMVAFVFIAPMVVFSVSRGTSIEFFEIALFFVSAFYIKSKIDVAFNGLRIYISIFLLLILGVSVFLGNVSLRLGESVFDDICFGPFCYGNALGSSLDPLFFFLSGYFLGGLYNISTFIAANEFISALYPGNLLFSRELDVLCNSDYVCAAWHPLLADFISIFGVFVIIPLLLMHKIVNMALKRSDNSFITCLIIYQYSYFVFSLFVGEGIFASSSNIIIFIFTATILFFKPIKLLGR